MDGMELISQILTLWMVGVGFIFIAALWRGLMDLRPGPLRLHPPSTSPSACEVLVPVTGSFPGQEEILATLLTQNHPNYRVLFIVEGEKDPANLLVDRLCRSHRHARKILSGPASGCGQKNQNLIKGLQHLGPETEIVAFCDAANRADPGWLQRFTRPLEADPDTVVTTFRDFNPVPPTLGGVCQALYGAFLLLLPRIRPSPWGGGTALHRRILERLSVTEAWSGTVVDDVVLGRLLHEYGVPMTLDRGNRLDSPLRNQSIRGFMAYLERQVLFPKFADPVLWFGPMALHLSLAIATLWALISGLVLFPLHMTDPWAGWTSWAFLAWEIMVALALRSANPHRVPVIRWLLALYPCIFLGAFVFLKSIFLKQIVWQNRCYRVGPGGAVLSVRHKDEG